MLKNLYYYFRKSQKTYTITIIAVVFVSLIMFWQFEQLEHVFQNIRNLIARITLYGFELVTQSTTIDLKIDYSNYTINTQNLSIYIIDRLAMKFYVAAAIFIFLFPRKWILSFLVLLLSFIFLYIVSIFRLITDVFFSEHSPYLYLPLVYSFRYLTLYAIIMFKIETRNDFKSFVLKIDAKIKDKFQFGIMQFLFIIIILYALISFMDWYVIEQSHNMIAWLTNLILCYSKELLHILGYTPFIVGNQIFLGNFWVYLGTPCLGVGIITVFCILILLIRSGILHKFLYIIFGINFLIFVNSIRIVVILLHIYLNQLPQKLIEDYHNMSNNFFYITVLFLIFIFVRWFKRIDFANLLKNKS